MWPDLASFVTLAKFSSLGQTIMSVLVVFGKILNLPNLANLIWQRANFQGYKLLKFNKIIWLHWSHPTPFLSHQNLILKSWPGIMESFFTINHTWKWQQQQQQQQQREGEKSFLCHFLQRSCNRVLRHFIFYLVKVRGNRGLFFIYFRPILIPITITVSISTIFRLMVCFGFEPRAAGW